MDAPDAVEVELQRRLRKLLEVTPPAAPPRLPPAPDSFTG